MNVYDFDHTIYARDSTIQFYLFCLRQQPRILKALPHQLSYLIKYYLKRCTKEEFKSAFLSFFTQINLDKQVEDFWSREFSHIRPWYINKKKKDDVIISASPEVLLLPVCRRLGVQLIATVVGQDGILQGINCYGMEKTLRFNRRYPDTKIDEFYSDSRSDYHLAREARQAFLVKGGKIKPW